MCIARWFMESKSVTVAKDRMHMVRQIVCVGFLSDPPFQYATRIFNEIARQPPTIIDLSVARNGFWTHYEDRAPVCHIRTEEVDVTIDREMSLFHRLISVTDHIRSMTRQWRGYRVAHYVFERLLDE